jgi:hypothetical protein
MSAPLKWSRTAEPDFEWGSAEADGLIAIPEQIPIAVYWNEAGNVVLRQQQLSLGTEDDVFIIVQPRDAEALARAITRNAAQSTPDNEVAELKAALTR